MQILPLLEAKPHGNPGTDRGQACLGAKIEPDEVT
jgi:hypothetical protein